MGKLNEAPIEEVITRLATEAVIKLFSKGDWIAPDYANRLKLPNDLVQRIYARIDFSEVVRIMGDKINEMVAVKITNAMVTEITSDVKHVLSDQPTRDRLRLAVAMEIGKIKAEAAS